MWSASYIGPELGNRFFEYATQSLAKTETIKKLTHILEMVH